MEICTIGFTKRSAEDFFETLRRAGIEKIVDVRLRPDSQLSGYSKARDLPYFAMNLLDAGYVSIPSLAPTAELLDGYRGKDLSWAEYEERYLALLDERGVGRTLTKETFDRRVVLLCSEREPARCHRRLAAEYLKRTWGGLSVNHL